MSNSSGGPQLPPGFYQDAQGTMRWWDGSGWTDQVQQQNSPPTSPYGQPSQTPNGSPAAEPWFKKKRWWIAGAVVVLLVAASVGGGETEDPTETASDSSASDSNSSGSNRSQGSQKQKAAAPSEEPTQEAAEEPAEPEALKVEAGQMLTEFEGNEAAADLKYDGKVVEVTGNVGKVDTEFLDEDQYIVMLDGGGSFAILSVNCNDVSADQAAAVQAGSTVTVRGTFDDGGDLGIELADCEVL